MKQSQRIVKNVLAGGLSVVLGSLIQLGTVVLIARSVSVSDFGIYSFILAFAMFFWLLADSGLTIIMVREMAVEPGRMAEILGASLSLIWILSIACELLILGIVPFLHFSLSIKLLTAVMGVATLTQFHCAGYGAALRSREDNEIQAIGYTLHKVLFFIFILIGLKLGLALVGIVFAHLIPNILLWGYFRWVVVARYGAPKLKWDPALWKYLMLHSIPVGGASMLRIVAQQIDVLILTWMSNARVVGIFSGPYRISMGLRFIPQTMAVPLYPMYSRMAKDPALKEQLHSAYMSSVKFFLLLSFPVSILFVVSSGQLISLLLGDRYREAIPAMQMLGAAFLPFFVSSPIPFLLTALNEQNFLLKSTTASVVLRIGLNVALIPFYGFLGPCIAFLVSEVAVLAIWMNKLARMGLTLSIGELLWRPLVASACMAATLFAFNGRSIMWLPVAALLSSVVYFGLLLKLNVFTPDQWNSIREGMGFMKPFLATWARKPRVETTVAKHAEEAKPQ